MWLAGEYLASTLFSLKPAWATSSGGKTLLLPTPFSIKMGLLSVVFHTEGAEQAEAVWPWLRDRQVALRPAQQAVVNNTFTRILKPTRGYKPGKGVAPLTPTIGYREYVYYEGTLGLGLLLDDVEDVDYLTQLMVGLNYQGKRGGFFQLTALPEQMETLPEDFIIVDGVMPEFMPNPAVMQQLDECDGGLSFEQVNIYSSKAIKLHKDRLLHDVVLRYRVRGSSRDYTWYVLDE